MKTFRNLFLIAGGFAGIFNLFVGLNQAELNQRAYYAAHMAFQHRYTEGQLNDVTAAIAQAPLVHITPPEMIDVRNVFTAKATGGSAPGSYSEATIHSTFCGIERTGYYRVTLGQQ